MVGIKVLKRNGSTEDFLRDKLVRSLKLAGVPDPDLVVNALDIKGIVPSSELSDRVQLIMLNMVTEDLRWHDAARNYLLWSVYKQVWGKDVVKAINDGRVKFEDAYREGFKAWFRTGLELRIWDSEMSAWYAQHIDELAKYLDPSRDLLLTYNGVRTLMSRYLLKRLDGSFFEAPQYLWMRTAMGVAYAELKYGGDPITWARRFYDLMSQLKFMPNSPTLYNAMTRLGQLSACFVVPIDDCLSRESDTNREDPECNFGIMDALRLAALIFQSGGGVGYNFGKLRPEGDIVRSTTGIASGPLSFMKLFDTLVDTIKQGGKRRGAQMGMLFWWHPDIEKFITSKSGELKDIQLQNFNISVTIDDYFMQKVLRGEDIYLINPRECPCLFKTWGEEFVKCYESCVEAIKAGRIRIWRRVNAKELWDKIVKSAWDSGDPGLWNRDLANYINNEKLPGEVINATNPCVTGDTRILTKNGYLRIGELVKQGVKETELVVPSETILIHAVPSHDHRAVNVSVPAVVRSKVFSQGIKPVYRVITKEGYELKATPDHRLIVATKEPCEECEDAPLEVQQVIRLSLGDKAYDYWIVWKRVDQLRPNDLVYLSRMDIDRLGKDFGSNSIGEDLAFALGWLVGDGFMYENEERHNGYVAWYFDAQKEEDIAQMIIDILRNRFPHAIIHVYYEGNEIKVMATSKDVRTYFKKIAPELVNADSTMRVVPEIVYTLRSSEIKAFLRGLFTADGTVDADSAIRLASASLKLLKEVQELLLLFGIMSTIYENRARNEMAKAKREFIYKTKSGEVRTYKPNNYHELVIRNYSRKLFMDKIGFADPAKNAKVSLKKTKVDPPLATVKKIEYIGEDEVFDTTVPNYHYYVAGGFISHNCSEESLYDFESCNLGSINLVKYVREGKVDWDSLARDVQLAVRFLDDVIDVNKLPHERLRKRVLETRRIGLGANGLADTLIALGLRYDSPQALAVSNELASFIARMAVRASVELAKEKGVYPAYKHSDWAEGVLPWTKHRERLEKFSSTIDKEAVNEYLKTLDMGYDDPKVKAIIDGSTTVLKGYRALDSDLSIDVSTIGIRNGSIMSIAPEGSRSLIAGVNSSIEPLFAIAYIRNLSIGKLIEYNYTALRLLMQTKTLDEPTRKFVEEYGILPRNHPLADLLRTAHEIHWRWHVYMQVTWARWNDSGVSKTINMPSNTPMEDVEQAYRLAWLLNAFGITVYRDKSKSVQVIYTGVKGTEAKPTVEVKEVKVEAKPKVEAKASYTSLSALKDKLVRIKSNGGESIEEEMQEELGETDDPYCRTGSCG
ncbi:ribonucleotide reductase N-terminal alpha domain-containing protein [Vulcanisaeta sp. JCM 16161]|uniref:ribonucleotide reductase N-terminal alpha domain-containing protein n=1 Tax=Vulcanisaeta sp. JCM 16161 TaxID=1295372 RepID=UPI00406CD592